eukprot:TRINITY_DN9827_c0_g1_i1.p1 TRINITY_DN9827_c0_g1~~TRINITY_DN9827_c0_g1_i1.p1  ORF type:complete len:136 (+),score=10.56 TRINITY_DN9827_c0_g1_i1:62-469(+)
MNLEQLGLLLPEDTKDLACWPFAKRYFSCQGPKGYLQSFYRDGKFSGCERESINYFACMKARWTSNSEDQRKLVIGEARNKIEAMSKSDNPVWQARKQPPATFHYYQVITPAEEERVFKEAMGDAIKSVPDPVSK